MPTQPGFRASILDRLLDPDSGGTAAQRGYSLPQLEDAIRKDLERLLNTSARQDMEQFRRLSRVRGYGMPDLVALSPNLQELCQRIKEKIEAHEPRIKDVTVKDVSVADTPNRQPLKVQLRIKASLVEGDPAPELFFEQTLDTSTGCFQGSKS